MSSQKDQIEAMKNLLLEVRKRQIADGIFLGTIRRGVAARQHMRNDITALKVSRTRLEKIIELEKARGKLHTADIKDLLERTKILERAA